MFSAVSNEFKIMVSSTRLNRLRYFAYSGFLLICMMLLGGVSSLVSTKLVENNLPFKLFISTLVISFLVPKYWFLKRRVNDTGRSFWSYFMILALAMILIFLPSTVTAALSKLGYVMQPLGAIAKIVTALTYLAGMGALLYASCIVVFFRGTPGENKFGATPPANNYFTISLFILYIAIMLGLNAMVIIQTQKAVADVIQRKQAAAMAASQTAELDMPVMTNRAMNANGIPADMDVIVN